MTRLEEMIENLKSSRKALKKAAKAVDRPEPVKRLSKTAAKDATIARLRAALLETQKIVADGAMSDGFSPLVGDWAERLYANQGNIARELEASK